jgi:YD repeat-containing protein
MAADDDGLQDWAADYDGEGRERAARDGRDSGMVMMAAAKMAAAEDSSRGGQQRQWWQSMAVENNSTQDWAVDYDGEGREQVANNGGIRHRT